MNIPCALLFSSLLVVLPPGCELPEDDLVESQSQAWEQGDEAECDDELGDCDECDLSDRFDALDWSLNMPQRYNAGYNSYQICKDEYECVNGDGSFCDPTQMANATELVNDCCLEQCDLHYGFLLVGDCDRGCRNKRRFETNQCLEDLVEPDSECDGNGSGSYVAGC